MKFPTGILQNMATSRFHPISFRPFPAPSDSADKSNFCRYRSLGHHTEGFSTMEEARNWISEQSELEYVDVVYEWDGLGIPAMTTFFPKK